MSGNMSFSKVRNSTLLNTTNAVPLTLMVLNTNSNASQAPLSAAATYQEADLWSFRIILSSLQELAFSNNQNSKIPPQLLKSIQNALINIKAEFDPKNPFLKDYPSSPDILLRNRGNPNPLACDIGASIRNDSLLGFETLFIPSPTDKTMSTIGSVAATCDETSGILNTIPSELKLVIRSLVSIHIRNMAKEIINMYGPVMDKAKLKTDTSNANSNKGTDSDLAHNFVEENHIQEALSGINSLLEKMKTDGQRLDREIEDLKAEREVEVQNYELEIQEMRAIVTQLAHITVAENQSDKAATYLDYAKQTNENLALKQGILEMEQELESNPPELVDELEEHYNKLKAAVDNLKKKNENTRNRISEYEVLGPNYEDLLMEYRQLEEEIKTKEWVHEQLANGAWDKSLSESFY